MISRALEPLVAILWGLFIAASVWFALVWIAPIDAVTLGFKFEPDAPPPPNAAFLSAVLLLAQNADIIWLAFAVVNLHLIVTTTNGLASARAWLGFTAGSAFLLGWLNVTTRIPFGGMAFGSGLGGKFLGVPVGWPLLCAALIIAAREAVLWVRPRASHAAVAAIAAVIVFATLANLEPTARHTRAWWDWFAETPRNPSSIHPWTWAAWFLWPWLILFAMREKDVVSSVTPRNAKPFIVLAVLNVVALIARFR